MRFTTAVAILAQVQPILSELATEPSPRTDIRDHSEIVGNSERQSKNFKSKMILGRAKSKYSKRWNHPSKECDPTSSNTEIGVLSCQPDMHCVPDKRSSMGGLCIQLSPDLLTNTEQEDVIPCDPTSSDPDTGILSCGDDSFCIKDPSTHIGGACVKISTANSIARRLEQAVGADKGRAYTYCDPNSPYFGMLTCDCTGFDLDAGKGSLACSYDYCFGSVSECCTDTCAGVTITYSSDGKGSNSYETCYTFESPYVQSFCYGHHMKAKNQSSTCFGSFNGKTCDSCMVESSNCTRFNCGSAGLGDEFCVEDFYPPILTSCYAECSTCSICAGASEETVLVKDQAFLSFTNFTCGYVEYLGELGMWGGSQNATCIDIRNIVEKECCMAQSQVPESSIPAQSPTLPVMTTAPNEVSTSVPDQPNEAPTVSPMSESIPALPPSWLDLPAKPDKPDTEGMDLICGIRIQSSKCKELLRAHTGIIPCDCRDKCITFIDDKFEKCDAGTSIAGSGSIVAGCTFQMAEEESFGCFEWDEETPTESARANRFYSSQVTLLLTAIPLLSLFFSF